MCERVMRKNNNLSHRPLTISAQYGLIDQMSFFNKTVASPDLSNYILIKEGEFAYNKSSSSEHPWGSVKCLTIYSEGALSPLYICFAPKHTVIQNWLVQYYESSKWYKEISEIATEGARNHGLLNVSVPDFFQTKLHIPSKAEQRKIAGFLRLLDERIAAQRALIGEMGRLMKGLNDYLNTKADKEFVLGDIGVFIRGLTFSNNDISDDGVCVLRSVNIQNTSYANYTDNIIYVNKSITPEQELRKGDIVICMANGSASLVGKNSVYDGNYSGRITVGAFCGIFRSSNRIARWLLQTSYYRGAVCRLKQGGNGAISNINGEDLMRLHFKSLQDSRVYYVLDLLSEKLNVLRMQLFKYQKQKEYFLQKMFL